MLEVFVSFESNSSNNRELSKNYFHGIFMDFCLRDEAMAVVRTEIE